MINRIVVHWHRAMAAFVPHLQPVIDPVLLTHLNIQRRLLPADHFAEAAFVQAQFGLNQIALVLDQPIDTVIWAASLLVGCQRNDNVSIGSKAFALVANQVGNPYRCQRLIV